MTEHEITKITGKATYAVVWEDGLPMVGTTTDVSKHKWHCSCGATFGSKEVAAEHMGGRR